MTVGIYELTMYYQILDVTENDVTRENKEKKLFLLHRIFEM